MNGADGGNREISLFAPYSSVQNLHHWGSRLTLVCYQAAPVLKAYVEPISIGAMLPEMPLFVDAEFYINVPLELTYEQTWEGFPAPWKQELLDA